MWLPALLSRRATETSFWVEGRELEASPSVTCEMVQCLLFHSDLSRRCVVVQLTASQEVLTSRVAERRGHFMPPSLVTSQLAVLEPLSAQEWPCLTCPTLGTTASVVQHIQQYISSLTQ